MVDEDQIGTIVGCLVVCGKCLMASPFDKEQTTDFHCDHCHEKLKLHEDGRR